MPDLYLGQLEKVIDSTKPLGYFFRGPGGDAKRMIQRSLLCTEER